MLGVVESGGSEWSRPVASQKTAKNVFRLFKRPFLVMEMAEICVQKFVQPYLLEWGSLMALNFDF